MTTPFELRKAFRLGLAFAAGRHSRLGLALDERWITIHPNGKFDANGKKLKGQPILIDDEGVVVGGAGGSMNGKKLSKKNSSKNKAAKNNSKDNQQNSQAQNQPSAFANSLGAKDYALYRKAISGGDPIALSLFNKAESRLKIGSLNSRSSYYSVATGEIFVNGVSSSAGGRGELGQSLSHESGHAIDKLASPMKSVFFSFYNTGFNKTILSDAKNYVDAKFREMVKDYHSLSRQAYLRKYKSAEVQQSLMAPTKSHAYAEISMELRSEPKDIGNYLTTAVISDIFGGATRNRVSGGFGHSTSYWSRPENLSVEAFADLFSVSLHCPEQMQRVEKFLPNTVKHYKKILQDMEKKL